MQSFESEMTRTAYTHALSSEMQYEDEWYTAIWNKVRKNVYFSGSDAALDGKSKGEQLIPSGAKFNVLDIINSS